MLGRAGDQRKPVYDGRGCLRDDRGGMSTYGGRASQCVFDESLGEPASLTLKRTSPPVDTGMEYPPVAASHLVSNLVGGQTGSQRLRPGPDQRQERTVKIGHRPTVSVRLCPSNRRSTARPPLTARRSVARVPFP
jgi:hypothetical protein